MRIAIVLQRRLGDALFQIPGVRMLRQQMPDAHISLLAPTELSLLPFRGSPDPDERLMIDTLPDDARWDWALAFHNYSFASALVERIGAQHAVPAHSYGVHPAVHGLRFVAETLGIRPSGAPDYRYHLYPTDEERMRAREMLAPASGKVLVGCQISCHGMNKRAGGLLLLGRNPTRAWPVRYYRRLLRSFAQSHPHVCFVLTGVGDEARIARKLRSHNTLDLTDRLRGLESLEVFSQCAVTLTPDTGTMHFAFTTPTRVLALFPSITSRATRGPCDDVYRFDLLRAGDMLDITPEQVADRLARMLRERVPAAG